RKRSFVPSSVPAGTVITRRFSTRTSPLPPQVWHRSEGTRPLPRHTGHGRFTAKPPCPNEITPRPRHSGQVDSVAPGAAPLPLQVGHTSAIGSVTGTLPPRAATRNGIVTVVSISSSSSEDAREQVPQPAERAEIREIEVDPGALRPGACPAAPSPGPIVRAVAAQPVVALALLGIAQDVVRLADFLEALRRLGVVGIAIGMVLLGEPPKRLLDFVDRRRLRDPEDLVVVLRRGHQPLSPRGRGAPAPPSCGRPPCQVSTVTRAGRISAPLS